MKKIIPSKKIQKQPKPRKKTEAKATKPRKQDNPKVKKPVDIEVKKTFSFGLQNLKAPKGANRKKRILGRGHASGHGRTSTRGSKGQTSRAGRDMYPGFEGGQTPLIRRMPKRGFTSQFKKEYQVVNLLDLNKIKETVVTPEVMEKQGLIRNKNKPVKILGEGDLKEAVTIQAHAFSKKACEKVINSGGKYEVLNA